MRILMTIGIAILLTVGTVATWLGNNDVAQTKSIEDDGIKVHGEWEVKVIGEDGNEDVFAFNNALVGWGETVLVSLLAGKTQVDDIYIHPILVEEGVLQKPSDPYLGYNLSSQCNLKETIEVKDQYGSHIKILATGETKPLTGNPIEEGEAIVYTWQGDEVLVTELHVNQSDFRSIILTAQCTTSSTPKTLVMVQSVLTTNDPILTTQTGDDLDYFSQSLHQLLLTKQGVLTKKYLNPQGVPSKTEGVPVAPGDILQFKVTISFE
jgi:hypothetical protein